MNKSQEINQIIEDLLEVKRHGFCKRTFFYADRGLIKKHGKTVDGITRYILTSKAKQMMSLF